ncbi:ATP-binding cassette domain-containing protein [Streptomyces sp. DSM 44915]|uniref:ATP-binding cassette domain-containing protein n=1 Tax=Streptomyces chisholmiae TaxID=3075540 RepID=A0ABU2JWW4_9ACTN|nr:ATP-binding cassette domain-containing protein [Streptomyces sp. DSM 44915]MDT0269491.1 ATP-binding cassette domain-containing protein [Streptomyces sp. DSM 44915]
MIEVHELTKRYGERTAVDRLSFAVRPGRVTGFLGPNGAGKSTTMRLVLGLDTPSGGSSWIGGRPYRSLPAPLCAVGSLLDAKGVHGGRSARAHLAGLAAANRLPRRRVDEVLELVGLDPATAGRRTRGFSLGMGQRLGIAAALLGDPEVLMLDEPVNGLDTDGIRWIRELMKSLAAEGRTVFLSSHLMSELELTVEQLIIIGRGRLLADTPMRDFIERHSQAGALVRSPEPERLREVLVAAGATVRPDARGGWLATGPSAAAIGELARANDLTLSELTPHRSSLEEVYTAMVASATEYRGRAEERGRAAGRRDTGEAGE